MKKPFQINYRDPAIKAPACVVFNFKSFEDAIAYGKKWCSEKGYFYVGVENEVAVIPDAAYVLRINKLKGYLEAGKVYGYINEMGKPTKEADYKTLQTLCCSGGLPLLLEVKL